MSSFFAYFLKVFANFLTIFRPFLEKVFYTISIPSGAETDVFTLPSSCNVCSTDKIP